MEHHLDFIEHVNRDIYYEAALVGILLICDRCQLTLDPDEDLGPQHSFKSDRYYVLLGNEAFQRGWLIQATQAKHFHYSTLCPECARKSQ